MSRRSILPQSRRHIWIYDEDWDFLDSRFGLASPSAIGTGRAAREIIHKRVKEMREKELSLRNERRAAMPQVEVGEAVDG